MRELQALVRRLDSLVEMRQMKANRLDVTSGAAAVRESLVGHLAFPDEGITKTEGLLSEILDVKLYEGARQLAAFAGRAPRLRKALYFPAIVAMRHNPHVRALSERLKERGKCPMQVIGAAMRELRHIAYEVLKSGRPLDPGMNTA